MEGDICKLFSDIYNHAVLFIDTCLHTYTYTHDKLNIFKKYFKIFSILMFLENMETSTLD